MAKSAAQSAPESPLHRISIVVPVFQGEHTLPALLERIDLLAATQTTEGGRAWCVAEVLLVHDGAKDGSAATIRQLAQHYPYVQPIWLSRNYGQHAATLAGISSSTHEWVATVDEDGQFDVADIGLLLDAAIDQGAQLVYGMPANTPPHGVFRNTSSKLAKAMARRIIGGDLKPFSSFRLMLGEVGRGAAAYVGAGVYLDVALSWVFGSVGSCPVEYRHTPGRSSGYTFHSLVNHMLQLVVSVGTRPLRLVSAFGAFMSFLGVVLAIVVVIAKIVGGDPIQGWASLAVIVLFLGGGNLFALGIIAEYIGATARMVLGKPIYLITNDPEVGPLHKNRPAISD